MSNTQFTAKLLILAGLFLSSCMPAKKVTFTPITDADSLPHPIPEDSIPTIPGTETFIPDPRDSFFLDLFAQHPGIFEEIVLKKDLLQVQILYTQIDRDEHNMPIFTQYSFNNYDGRYHYPASTVKFPIALLSLQKINDLRLEGFNKYSTMITEMDADWQTAVYNDPTTPNGKPNIAQYIKKIFLYSDNDASNRLYEFLGQDYLNEQLQLKGFTETQILHRLSLPLSTTQNQHTNPIHFYDDAGKLMLSQPAKQAQNTYAKRNDWLGKGYIEAGKMIESPMDFSSKNRLPLFELHQMLQTFIFPNSVSEEKRFRLTEANRKFVLQYMSQYPSETTSPVYPAEHPDAAVKFLLLGGEDRTIPKSVRIFNKSGIAYGQLTDAAYIVDFERNIEFMISATILCNSDGILNDDHYDYDTVGLPFMKQLGLAIYQREAKRKKAQLPNLTEFQLSYDK